MKKIYAYSLVELMVTLSLVAILLFIATPAWNSFVAHNSAVTGVDRVVVALQFVRLEAIKRGINVSLCRVGSASSVASDWSGGQIARDANNKRIRVFEAVPRQDKLFWNGSLGQNECVTFTPVGITAGQNGDFVYCPQGKADHALAIIVQAIGEVRVVTSLPDGRKILCGA